MNTKHTVYITGHRHPDTDSIVSAIAYAHLKNRQGIEAIPCRLGPINTETQYLLNYFHAEVPMLLEDARSTLQEIELDEPVTIAPTTTLQEAMDTMSKTKRQSLGVENHEGRLMGLITRSDISAIGMGDTALSIQLLKETPTEFISKTLSGNLVYNDPERHFNGKVSIVAIAETRLRNYVLKDRLVIVGNDQDAQVSAIVKGAGILVIVWSDSVGDEVLKTAKKHHCPIIISGHGSMNTSRYLFFAPPVKLLMKTNLTTFNFNEFVDEVGTKMLKSRFRSYPVIDDENRLFGYASRFHILNQQHKKMILVDHNEYTQSVKSIEKADLLEVIDHHRICDIFTNRPISFRNEIIGSTASIITSIYLENQMTIPPDIAGLLLGAIISDTLKFKSPTTTEKDKGIASMLAKIANIDIEEFSREMFKVTSNIRNKSMRELITQDIKHFEIENKKIMIAQVIVFQLSEATDIEALLQKEMQKIVSSKGLDLLVVAFTSILENASVFYGEGEYASVLKEAFPNKAGEEHSFQEDILSRKNQMVPLLSRAFINSL